MKVLYILRGVSGSGKSTRADELIVSVKSGCVIKCSADDFFVDRDTGTYNFDPAKLSQAHLWCKARADTAMELGVDLVIIDNTNTQRWEFGPYLKLADRWGYEVKIEVVGALDDRSLEQYAARNQHGVSLEVIKKQAKRFEA